MQHSIKSTFIADNNELTLAEQVTSTVYDLPDPTTDLVETIPVAQKEYTLRNQLSFTRTYDLLLANENGTSRR